VAIPPGLAFLLGLEVSVTPSFTISFPKSIFLFYFYSYTISVLYHLVSEHGFVWEKISIWKSLSIVTISFLHFNLYDSRKNGMI
jgi:hypothetical protein